MRDFDSIKQKEMGSIENRVRHIYNRGYEDGYKDGRENIIDTYDAGLNDAWECAERIAQTPGCGGLTSVELKEIFGSRFISEIMQNNTASDAIAKVKAWEEKQKKDDEIKIGDEVLNKWGTKGIVIEIAPQHNGATVYSVIWRNVERRCLDKSDWDSYEVWKKTGRHFPEIAEVLKRMQEVEE